MHFCQQRYVLFWVAEGIPIYVYGRAHMLECGLISLWLLTKECFA